jgi:hypothetical protein
MKPFPNDSELGVLKPIVNRNRMELRCYNYQETSSGSNSHPQATPQQMADLYNQYLPQILSTTLGGAGPIANTIAGTTANANPIYTASGLNQLNQYSSGYQNAGANLAADQALSQAQLLGGSGGLYAMMGAGLTNLLNPAQAASNTQASNLVNSINLNGLSGGERAEVERSLNQSNYARGNLGIDNATNTVSNAMNFGNALQAKRDSLGNALGAAGGVAANQNAAFNPISAIGNASNVGSNFGLTQYNPTQANAFATTPFTFSTGFGNQMAGVASSPVSNSSSGGMGGGCCFIFLEATNGSMPWWVRECRDEYYAKMPVIATGYKRMARVLVPLMQRFTLVKFLVNKLMVIPMTKYGGYLKNVKGYEKCGKYLPFKKFWFSIWKLIGGL